MGSYTLHPPRRQETALGTASTRKGREEACVTVSDSRSANLIPDRVSRALTDMPSKPPRTTASVMASMMKTGTLCASSQGNLSQQIHRLYRSVRWRDDRGRTRKTEKHGAQAGRERESTVRDAEKVVIRSPCLLLGEAPLSWWTHVRCGYE
jgi:hypothetical protein